MIPEGIPGPDWSEFVEWLGTRSVDDWRRYLENLDDQQVWALAETMKQAIT